MNDQTIFLTENDSVFEYLADNITTVSSALEAIKIVTSEDGVDLYYSDLSVENAVAVLSLDKSHYYNDDFFDLDTNKALTKQDIFKKYNIKLYSSNCCESEEFKEPEFLNDLSIMGVFQYDLLKSA